MDTKSKNIERYPLPVKGLCLVLAAALLFLSAYSALEAGVRLFIYGIDEVTTLGSLSAPSFEDTNVLNEMFANDAQSLVTLAEQPDRAEIKKQLEKNKDSETEKALNRYLAEKAQVIEDELYYVATHYDGYEDNVSWDIEDDVDETVPTTVHSADEEVSAGATSTTAPPEVNARKKVAVDENAPLTVRRVQKILNSTQGLEYLKYESLVRPEAFREKYIDLMFDIPNNSWSWSVDLSMSEDEAKKNITEEYSEAENIYLTDLLQESKRCKNKLSETVNLKYYAADKNGKVVISNMTAKEAEEKSVVGHMCYFFDRDGMRRTKGTGDRFSYDNAPSSEDGKTTVVLFLEDDLKPGDDYYTAITCYDELTGRGINECIIGFAVCFVLAIVFSVMLFCFAGHKRGYEGITLAFIDKVPTDVHFAVSVGLLIAAAAGFFGIMTSVFDRYDYISQILYLRKLLVYALSALVMIFGLIGIEWLTSVIRIKKSGESFFKRCIIVKLFALIFKGIRRLFKKLKKLVTYKPGHIKLRVILLAVGYIALNVLFFALTAAGAGVFVLAIILLNGAAIFFALKYFISLDRLITAAKNREIIPYDEKQPESLRILADSLRYNNDELQTAVNKAIKNERMRAELITNVSHDLKTPLTSVISYVELLKKCGITDETACGYIDVLDEKAVKLKRLIDDLIEASKVSSGNVTLNNTIINLGELTVQAIGEMNDDFEKNGLEIISEISPEPPMIFADSQKTFRVIDNLMNNARKYSAKGSRVYINTYSENGYGAFEIKNMSAEPLNISPDELTERFVRGDESRTREGNGLGLSIAKDLCVLMGGSLSITIDGDLFKATVRLPEAKEGQQG
ncbi:MAG: HAMP domain-containing histidine kinase [Clostridiales bacterium]|nr:HAMP domain-containing histidine kinase [Clostridiales bacterium]